MLKTRPWWENVGKSNIMINLQLTQYTRPGEFQKLPTKPPGALGQNCRCLNRLEGYKHLNEKDLFFINMFNYCEVGSSHRRKTDSTSMTTCR